MCKSMVVEFFHWQMSTVKSAAAEISLPPENVLLKDVQPNQIVSKLDFNLVKCPLFLSENGNATALYRYSNSGPFIELSNPSFDNLIPALKYSIIQGVFCNFNFGLIEHVDQIVRMLEEFQKACFKVHRDLAEHILRNSLMKQSFDSLMSLIPFDPIYEMVPEIYRNSKATFRLLFFAQLANDVTLSETIKSQFHCIYVKP